MPPHEMPQATSSPDLLMLRMDGMIRALGQVEGRIEGLAQAMRSMAEDNVRAGAERDNLARDVQQLERRQDDAMTKLKDETTKALANISHRMYWGMGFAAGGGAAAVKALGAVFALH